MKEIKLTKGKIALVDDDDFERLNQFKWQAVPVGKNSYGEPYWYATRGEWVGNGKTKTFSMHREIIGVTSSSQIIDHKDFNTLNNRKDNLRVCTKADNCRHTRAIKNKKSKYVGVSWINDCNKWMAKIRANKKQTYLGTFTDEADAARAYNDAAAKYHGEFASLNIVPE